MKRTVALVIAALFLLSGVIVMARIRAAQAPKPVTMSRFYGLNTANELQAKPGESPDMDNFRITDDYRLKKREGLVPLGIDFDEVINEGTPVVKCTAWYGQLKKDNKKYLHVFALYQWAEIAEEEIYGLAIIKVDIENKSATLVVKREFEYSYTNTTVFYKNGYLYNMDGLTFQRYDGESSEFVSGTIPTLYVGVKPNLSDRADKAYQPINILTDYRRVNYYADGTAVYTLPEEPMSVDKITVNGIVISRSDYNYYPLFEEVTFTSSIPPAGAEVIIEYDVYTGSSNWRNEIEYCKHAMAYGGNQDADIFLWGSSYRPHKMYYTYGGDPEFFGATNYITFGTADSGITGAAIQNNALAVFTKNGVYSLKTQLDTNPTSLVTTVTYPITYVKADRGHAYANCDIQVIRNNPFFIGADNSIWELAVSSYRDDRAARYISERVQALLKTLDLSKAFTIDWEAKGEYWLVSGGTAVIYNYRNDTWYKFTLPVEASGGLIVEDKLMLYDLTDVYVFDDEALQDGAVPINAYWESPYMDYGASYLNKSVRSMYITMAAEREADSFVRLEYYTSDNENPETAEFLHEAGEPPKPLYTDISAVGFRHIKYKFVSDKYDAAGHILGFTTPVTYGGYVR